MLDNVSPCPRSLKSEYLIQPRPERDPGDEPKTKLRNELKRTQFDPLFSIPPQNESQFPPRRWRAETTLRAIRVNPRYESAAKIPSAPCKPSHFHELAASEIPPAPATGHTRDHHVGTMKIKDLTSLALIGRKTPRELLDPPFASIFIPMGGRGSGHPISVVQKAES